MTLFTAYDKEWLEDTNAKVLACIKEEVAKGRFKLFAALAEARHKYGDKLQ